MVDCERLLRKEGSNNQKIKTREKGEVIKEPEEKGRPTSGQNDRSSQFAAS